MSRIAKILVKVRDSLADPDGDRWSDARLLRLVDEAQIDIAVKNNLLRAVAHVGVTLDQNIYTLPEDATKIARVASSTGQKITVRSHAQMDDIDPLWEITEGDAIQHIVFDKQQPGVFKVYPIPTASDVSDTFVTSDYGVTVDITDDTLTSPYGVVVDINESASLTKEFNSVYGVVTDMSAILTSLVIYYHRRPIEIISSEDVLEIDEMYDKAIKHYVVGISWRDDKDTQNRILGNEELEFYAREFKEAKKDSSADHQASSQQESHYNNGFRR